MSTIYWYGIAGLGTMIAVGVAIIVCLRIYKYQLSVFNGVLPKRGERYYHKKTGHVYTCLGVGRHHDTHAQFIIYENEGSGEIWLREPVSWMSASDDGGIRFKYLDADGKFGRPETTTVKLSSPAPSVVEVTGPGAIVVTENK